MRSEYQNEASIKVLVVEDEIITARDIAYRIGQMGYEVIGTAATAQKALELLEAHPDTAIALLDIILKGDMDGIELARIINKKHGIPFLFLTSHSQAYLVDRARSVKPHAYLLKPFNDRQVHVAMVLALTNFSANQYADDQPTGQETISDQEDVLQIKDSLFLRKDHHFKRVRLNDILFLEADNNYTTIMTVSQSFIYSIVLKKVESRLPAQSFMRVHRSYVVNIDCVSGFEGNLLYIGNNKIPVSNSYRDKVFKLFNAI